MRLRDELCSIDVGAFVMNYHHGLLRLGVVRHKRTGDHGWTYCKVDWLEDNIHLAGVVWKKKMDRNYQEPEEIRVDWLKPVSPKWLQDVITAYGEYQNERRTEIC